MCFGLHFEYMCNNPEQYYILFTPLLVDCICNATLHFAISIYFKHLGNSVELIMQGNNNSM